MVLDVFTYCTFCIQENTHAHGPWVGQKWNEEIHIHVSWVLEVRFKFSSRDLVSLLRSVVKI